MLLFNILIVLLNFFKYFFLIVHPDLEIAQIKISSLILPVQAKCDWTHNNIRFEEIIFERKILLVLNTEEIMKFSCIVL